MTVEALGRAVDLYRRTATSRSALVLVLANLIPLIGVLFFDWSLLTILVLFWIENGIVGFWNIPRILLARGSLLAALPGMSADAAFAATGDAAAEELRAKWQGAQAQVTVEQSGTGTWQPMEKRRLNPVGLALARLGGAGRAILATWFLIHYGIFWLAHGIFVFALPTFLSGAGAACLAGSPVLPPGFPVDPGLSGLGTCSTPFGAVVWSNVAIAAVALFLSHGTSFFLNYLGKREYVSTVAVRQAFAPYGRVVVLHLTILIGAFAIGILGAPVGALVILVVLKTVLDLRLHLRQHSPTAISAPATA